MAGKIFINYRRGDDPGNTGRLFDRLQEAFEPQQLFLDVDNIAPGLDFVHVINDRVAESDVVLAVIGKGWIDARDAAGARRLDKPEDFVRIEIASALNQDKRVIPVLVGDAAMPHAEQLPDVLRPLATRNAVRLTHERFRADVQGLIKALRQTLEEFEARRQVEAEAARRAQAEEERLFKEAEATRRAAELEQKRKAEKQQQEHAEEERRRRAAEAKQRAEEEHRRQELTAKQRAEEERAFAVAKRTGTVLAFDAFLAVHAASAFADEARKLNAALVTRQDAYRHIATSDDPAELRSFLSTYKRGPDIDQVRRRLRLIEAQQGRQPGRLPVVAVSALAAVLIAGAAFYWLELKPMTSIPQSPSAGAPSSPGSAPVISAAPAPLSDSQASVPASAPMPSAETPPSSPSPDQAAWDLLGNTTDTSALQRFITLYPDSPQRAEAEKRIAELTAKQEQAAATQADAAKERARLLQFELKRVGCFTGEVNGEFDDATKAAWHNFTKLTSVALPDEASDDAVKAVRALNKRVCPLQCPAGQHADGETCLVNTPPPKPANAKCFSFGTRQLCPQ